MKPFWVPPYVVSLDRLHMAAPAMWYVICLGRDQEVGGTVSRRVRNYGNVHLRGKS